MLVAAFRSFFNTYFIQHWTGIIFKAGTRRIDVNQEMFALGICNLVGSFFKSMPTTGSFSRTTVNYSSGVKSPAGGIYTGILVLLVKSLAC
jgi:MFS superfamily sulfate permease-like transporter